MHLTCCSCRTRTGAREWKCEGGGGSSPFHTTSTSATAAHATQGGTGHEALSDLQRWQAW